MSQMSKRMVMRNERYPSGINLKAFSGGSRKGLGLE